MRRKLLIASLGFLSSVPVAALAARAYTVGGAQIFAGPGDDYPVVAQVGRGAAVNVNGCLRDYTWCDVNLGQNRGWVYAQDLAYPYRNQRVLIPEYGPQLGLPLITFSFNPYWDQYYRGRPFYKDRAHWEERSRTHEHARFDDQRHDGDRRRADVTRDQYNREGREQERAIQPRGSQERVIQERTNQTRGESRTNFPDLPGGGQQGLPPGDHSRYQQ